MKMRRICARCGKGLKASEVGANYNNVWFSCLPCWDKSEGFFGWPFERPAIMGPEPYVFVLVV